MANKVYANKTTQCDLYIVSQCGGSCLNSGVCGIRISTVEVQLFSRQGIKGEVEGSVQPHE